MERQTSRVYVLTDEENRIIRCEGEYSLPEDLTGWVLIEEGPPCDRLNLAQRHYFEKPLTDLDGTHNYMLDDTEPREATEEEKEAERASFPAPPPSREELLEQQLAELQAQMNALLGVSSNG